MTCAQGDYAGARSLLEESLTIARELGDNYAIGIGLGNLGNVASLQGDYDGARVLFEESLTIARELGDKSGVANSLINLGNVTYAQGDYDGGRLLYAESLTIAHELGDRSLIADNLEGVASLASKEAQEAHSVRLWGAAAALRETTGSGLTPAEREKQEREMALVREMLGEDAFAAAWAEGRAMTMEQAIAYALEEPVNA